jgi:hypothetical protein
MEWGQIEVTAHRLGWSHEGCTPHEFSLLGQVGQESHWRPAVVEVAALGPVTFRLVPGFDESQVLRCLVFRIVLFRSTALLPNLLPQAQGNTEEEGGVQTDSWLRATLWRHLEAPLAISR